MADLTEVQNNEEEATVDKKAAKKAAKEAKKA